MTSCQVEAIRSHEIKTGQNVYFALFGWCDTSLGQIAAIARKMTRKHFLICPNREKWESKHAEFTWNRYLFPWKVAFLTCKIAKHSLFRDTNFKLSTHFHRWLFPYKYIFWTKKSLKRGKNENYFTGSQKIQKSETQDSSLLARSICITWWSNRSFHL